jgi:hypothetical protein
VAANRAARVQASSEYAAPAAARRAADVVRLIGLIVIILAALIACSFSTVPERQEPTPPDFTILVSRISSSDSDVQELALRPEMRARPNETPGLLPAGSSLALELSTWEAGYLDESGAPLSGTIQARLTLSAKPEITIDLHVVRLEDEWFVSESSPA